MDRRRHRRGEEHRGPNTGATPRCDGDRAEHTWLPRITPRDQPHFSANLALTLEERTRLTPAERFAGMASRHGETIGFVVDDLLELPADRMILVDWFGNMPRDVRPLLERPAQAVFLLPTPEFRRRMLSARYADPDRARANWGDADPARALETRLARAALFDAEVRQQATELGLHVVDIDGCRGPDALAADVAGRFR